MSMPIARANLWRTGVNALPETGHIYRFQPLSPTNWTGVIAGAGAPICMGSFVSVKGVGQDYFMITKSSVAAVIASAAAENTLAGA